MNLDDKQMVIIAATVLGGMAMCIMATPETVVSNIITGLFGIAVGRSYKAE